MGVGETDEPKGRTLPRVARQPRAMTREGRGADDVTRICLRRALRTGEGVQ